MTFAIELIDVLRISMLPRDDTQNERTNKKRLWGFPHQPNLGSYRQRNNLSRYQTSKLYHEIVIFAGNPCPLGRITTLHYWIHFVKEGSGI